MKFRDFAKLDKLNDQTVQAEFEENVSDENGYDELEEILQKFSNFVYSKYDKVQKDAGEHKLSISLKFTKV